MTLDSITELENLVSEYFGAPYAVATDCCTHALELCLRLQKPTRASCPTHTYLSVPMTFMKLGIPWEWKTGYWENYYRIGDSNIIDAAVLWQKNSYIPGTMMCLSFQFRKHLGIGRGGMILLDDRQAAETLAKMSYDGRDRNQPWAEQNINVMGYHYYMTPEVAATAIKKFHVVKDLPPKVWNTPEYPDISKFEVFANVK